MYRAAGFPCRWAMLHRAVAALLSLLWFCSEAPAAYYSMEGVVAEVVDGDTVYLSDGTAVRYLGINTPEVRKKVHRKWVYDPKPYALEATRHNREWIEGKTVRLEVDGTAPRDRYGRLLAYVFVGSLFVNERLLEAGLGRTYLLPPHTRYNAELKRAQAKAKAARLGIWSASKP